MLATLPDEVSQVDSVASLTSFPVTRLQDHIDMVGSTQPRQSRVSCEQILYHRGCDPILVK